ncbi:MAG: hypothetical protein JWO05_1170 [Gemmatimonadetes bacterium]|nr:hypothetical protein [Gemmatimonadota bacterium]
MSGMDAPRYEKVFKACQLQCGGTRELKVYGYEICTDCEARVRAIAADAGVDLRDRTYQSLAPSTPKPTAKKKRGRPASKGAQRNSTLAGRGGTG